MRPNPSAVSQDGQRLGLLAVQFRGTRDEAARRAVAADYAETVGRLIRNGGWHEAPAPEDQLPDAWMPPEFFAYWSGEGDDR